MRVGRRLALALSLLLCVGLACGAGAESVGTPPGSPTPVATFTAWPAANEAGLRFCLYNPMQPAAEPKLRAASGTETPVATATLPSGTGASSSGVARQMSVYRGLWNAVNDNYVDPGFNGRDWEAIGTRYQALVEQGLSDEAFFVLMRVMVNELGDEHSYFQSPAEVQEEAAAIAGQLDFVGIGALLLPVSGEAAAVISLFPDGPAAQAGLQVHDVVTAVDGGAVRDPNGYSRTRGPEGTAVTLTVRTPGEAPRDVALTRRRVTGGVPLQVCLVPGTRVGYVMLPTFEDETIDDSLREALTALTADGPLDGLILDNRMNGGGLGSVAQQTLGMFLGGPQGAFVTRTGREELVVEPEDLGGSQSVPLVVLVGPDTVSYGEVVSGVLQLAGRATIVGQPTLGNVEQLRRYDFEDGSRAWIASATFEPLGLPAGIWEETGIVPDVSAGGAWDEFSEANDPGLAAAVEILLERP